MFINYGTTIVNRQVKLYIVLEDDVFLYFYSALTNINFRPLWLFVRKECLYAIPYTQRKKEKEIIWLE